MKNQYLITRSAANNLAELRQQSIEPLRDLLLNYVEHVETKANVKLKLIKDITNYEHFGELTKS